MAATYDFSTSTLISQKVLRSFNSRRLLLHSLYNSPPIALATSPTSANQHDLSESRESTFDVNVVMVLSVLICALICAVGLNTIIRCTLRCSSPVSSESSDGSSARLANTGIKKNALQKLPIRNYTSDIKMDTECAICLTEFTPGERVRVLPNCCHGFHVRCIDKWLNSHSSCPTCRHCLIEACKEIVGCSQVSSSTPVLPSPEEVIIRIEPLKPEDLTKS